MNDSESDAPSHPDKVNHLAHDLDHMIIMAHLIDLLTPSMHL